MDYPGRRLKGPIVGTRRGENQCCNTRAKEMEKNNEHHEVLEGNLRKEDYVDRVENIPDKEVRKTS
jgi:hypothetical protein